MLIKEVRKYCT